jgi:hypothetical protein
MAQATSSATKEKFQTSLIFSSCNGENVALEVTTTIVMHISVSNSGRVNFKIAITEHATGVGQTTGARYVGNSTQEVNEHFDGSDGAPYNFTFPNHLNLNGQGRVENLRVKEFFHITVNANGDITSFKEEMSAECH